jgi:hypothetical protein
MTFVDAEATDQAQAPPPPDARTLSRNRLIPLSGGCRDGDSAKNASDPKRPPTVACEPTTKG